MMSHNTQQLATRIANMGYNVSSSDTSCIVKDQGANIIVTTDEEWDSYLKSRDEYVNEGRTCESCKHGGENFKLLGCPIDDNVWDSGVLNKDFGCTKFERKDK